MSEHSVETVIVAFLAGLATGLLVWVHSLQRLLSAKRKREAQ